MRRSLPRESLTPAPRLLPYVGRRAELEAARAALGRSRSDLYMLVVRGISGMGKSTFVTRFLDRATSDGVLVCSGRCAERESKPFQGLAGVVECLAEHLATLTPDERTRLLPPDASILAQVFPVMQKLVPITEGPDPSSRRGQRRLFRAIYELLHRLGEERPTVVSIDDCQWADPDTLRLLADVTRSYRNLRVLFVLATRGEGTPADREIETLARARGTSISLGPLTREEQRELVLQYLSDEDSISLDEGSWAEADGNPLLLTELARHLSNRPAGQGPVHPVTFEQALLGRIAALPSDARELVLMSMVAGEPLPAGVLGRAAALDDARTAAAVDAALASHMVRVVRAGDERWLDSFHTRLREAIVPNLRARQVQGYLESLIAILKQRAETPPDTMARLLMASGDRIAAGKQFLAAAQQAQASLSFEVAVTLYGQALEHGGYQAADVVPIMRGLADCLAASGRSHEAAETYAEAADMSLGLAQTELVALSAAEYLRAGYLDLGQQALQAVFDRLGMPLPVSKHAALASLLWRRARLKVRGLAFTPRAEADCERDSLVRLDLLYAASVSLGMLDHLRGADYQARGMLMSLDLGEENRVGKALFSELMFRGSEGQRTKDVARLDAMLADIARRTGRGLHEAHHLASTGCRHVLAGQFGVAIPFLDDGLKAYREHTWGLDMEIHTTSYFRLLAVGYVGELAVAARDTAAALVEAEEARDVYARNLFSAEPNLWRLLLADDPDAADAGLAQGLAGWPADRYTLAHYRNALGRAELFLYRGEAQAALDHVEQAIVRAKAAMILRVPHSRAQLYQYLGLAGLATGNLAAVKRAERALRKTGFAPYIATARALDTLARSTGDAAVNDLSAAVNDLDAASYALLAMPMRHRLGQLMGGDAGAEHRSIAESWAARHNGAKDPVRFLSVWSGVAPQR